MMEKSVGEVKKAARKQTESAIVGNSKGTFGEFIKWGKVLNFWSGVTFGLGNTSGR